MTESYRGDIPSEDIDAEFAALLDEMSTDTPDYRALNQVEDIFEHVHESISMARLERLVDYKKDNEAGLMIQYMEAHEKELLENLAFSKNAITEVDRRRLFLQCYKDAFEEWEAQTQFVLYATEMINDEIELRDPMLVDELRDTKLMCRARLEALFGMSKDWLNLYDDLTHLKNTGRQMNSEYVASLRNEELQAFEDGRELRWLIIDEAAKIIGIDVDTSPTEKTLPVYDLVSVLQTMGSTPTKTEFDYTMRNANMWQAMRIRAKDLDISDEIQREVIDYLDAMYPPDFI